MAGHNIISLKDTSFFSTVLEEPGWSQSFDFELKPQELLDLLGKIDQLYTSLLEHSLLAVAIMSQDGILYYVNPALVKLTGFTRTELLGQSLPYPFWAEDKRESNTRLMKEMLLKANVRSEIQLRTKRGNSIWGEMTIIPCFAKNSKYYLVNYLDITERKLMRDEMDYYLREVIRIQEEERKRIARELHDDTAQSLAFIALELDSLTHNGEIIPEKVSKRLLNLKQQVDNSLKEVRRFSHELRPGVLDHLGLLAALEMLVDEINSCNQVHIKFNCDGEMRRLNSEEEQALFRIAQEALSNIRKHSLASEAGVTISFGRKKIKMTISDNGKGFLPSEVNQAMAKGRLGLIGMKERARLINGVLALKSKPNQGTVVTVELTKGPLANLN